jgi:hypothetical protein
MEIAKISKGASGYKLLKEFPYLKEKILLRAASVVPAYYKFQFVVKP